MAASDLSSQAAYRSCAGFEVFLKAASKAKKGGDIVKNALKMFVLAFTVLAFAGVSSAADKAMEKSEKTTEKSAEKKEEKAKKAKKAEKSEKKEEGKPAK
jgi:hypothetical protein